MKIISKGKGFTMVEIFISLTILAILGTLSFFAYTGYTKTARNTQRTTELLNISKNIDVYGVSAGKYPDPSSGVNITYSGATLWLQGTFGDSMHRTIKNPGKKPVDILTKSEFTYSVADNRQEYQVAAMLEAPNFLLQNTPLLPQAYALGSIAGSAYITGKFNGKVLPAYNGTTLYYVIVPSMVATDLSSTDYVDIVTNNKLAFHDFSAIPASYTTSSYQQGQFSFNPLPTNIEAFSGTLSDLYNEEKRITLIDNIQKAYSGSNLAGFKDYQTLLGVTIDTNNPSEQVKDLGCNLIATTLKLTAACNPLFAGTGTGTVQGGDTVFTEEDLPLNINISDFTTGTINNVFIDGNGNLWFASQSDGVGMYDGENWTIYNSSNSPLLSNTVYSIAQDVNNNMWFGTHHGLNKLSGTTWSSFTQQNSGLLHNKILAAYGTNSGDMWFATQSGVSRLVGTTWTSFKTNNSGILSNTVNFITEDHNGYIWFGTNQGASRYNPAQSPTTGFISYRTSNGLVDKDVQAIFEDSNYDMWFGTDAGISFYDVGPNTYTNYKTNNSGLVNNNIKSFFQDSRGYMWIGTGGGLSEKVGTTWTNYITPDGLAGNVVYQIYEESDTDIVILTEGGATTIDF